jgi:hypothetical protein
MTLGACVSDFRLRLKFNPVEPTDRNVSIHNSGRDDDRSTRLVRSNFGGDDEKIRVGAETSSATVVAISGWEQNRKTLVREQEKIRERIL